jgi:AraC-like DNA-binding protein
MEHIGKKLHLEHFSCEAFIHLLDFVINEVNPYRLIIAAPQPVCRENIEINKVHVFDLPLSGTKHIMYGNGTELEELRMVPGEVFYTAPLIWKRPLWDCAHEMTSFVYSEKFIRLTYVDITIPPEPGMYPKSTCFYHTQIPPSEAILKLLSVIKVLGELGNPGNAAPEIMRGLFRLTRELLKNDTSPVYSKAQVTYQRIQQFLRDNFQAPINRKHIGRIFKLHPGYISRLYLENGSQTFSEVLHSLRLEHAALLLKTTDLLVDEITMQCGYESPTYFTAAFKKYFGIPPGRFRQQFLQCHTIKGC